MPKISIEDLDHIKARARSERELSENATQAKITMHMGACGIASGASVLMLRRPTAAASC